MPAAPRRGSGAATRSVDQLDEALGAVDLVLDEDQCRRLDSAG
ncbi:hypothetical protein [Kitasatospora sp. NPDC094011]